MDFFKYFPKIEYDIEGDGKLQSLTNVTAFIKVSESILNKSSFYTYYTVQDGDRPDNVSMSIYGTVNYYWTLFIINDHLRNSYDNWPKGSAQFNERMSAKYPTTAGIFPFNQTVAGKFVIGETIQGAISGATGTLVAKYPTLGFIEMTDIVGTFNSNGETLFGTQTEDNVVTDAIVDRAQAPHHHVSLEDGESWVRRTQYTTKPVSHYEWEWDQNIINGRLRVIKPEFIKPVVREFIKEMKK